jgi:hypothetical protein
MPTQIDSAGITFNDATSLTSANIGTAQLVNGSVIASKLGTNEQKQICKAWVNFDGTTSPGTIRSAYNVSSVTKNGTGDYTVNFATPMADANYSFTSSGSQAATGSNIVVKNTTVTNTTTALYILSLNASNGAAFDETNICVQVFGN